MEYNFHNKVVDPVRLVKFIWPHVQLYNKQAEIMYSVLANDQTVVPAGNMLGKDFVSALVALVFFMTRHPCRVVTSSVDQSQLDKVLWGEINNFVQTAAYPLPFISNYCHIQKIVEGKKCKKSYIIGKVAKTEEGLLGHHLPWGPNNAPATLMIYDEASGIEADYKSKTDTWAHRTLIIGNPYDCANFFRKGADAGDIPRDNGKGFHSKIIRIKATDSPSVRLGIAQAKMGIEPTNEIVIPGLLTYGEYLKRRKLFDRVLQSISLDAEFWEGSELLLYPPEWLNRSAQLFTDMKGSPRHAKAIGIDPAEGGDKTTMSAIDEFGLIEQTARKTKDTNDIVGEAISFWQGHGVDPENVGFDTGGGGKQHADRLRAMGFPVRTIAFGETASDPHKFRSGVRSRGERKAESERQYTFCNRRAEMYWLLSLLLDPTDPIGFAISPDLYELRRQMSFIRKLYDGEGRCRMLPKHKKRGSKEECLVDLIGNSPDELDSLVIAAHILHNPVNITMVGAF